MATRKGKKETKGAKGGSFADFMAQTSKNSGLIDLSTKEEKYYKLGDYNLDRALGGGIVAGSVVAMQGPSGTGKSLSAIQLAREVVDEGGRVAYFDTENKISQKALRMMNVKDRMGEDGYPLFNHFTIEDNNLEDLLGQIIQMAESGFFKMIVIDSVDSLQTTEQEEREIGDSKVGGYKAKILSEVFPQIIAAIQRGGVESEDGESATLVLVRQVRDNPGAMYGGEQTSGGRAIEFFSTTILRYGTNSKDNVEIDGKLVYQGATVAIKKHNQGALPKNAIPIRFYIGDDAEWGIDPVNSLVDAAVALQIIPPKNATSHMYIGCDELCEKLEVAPGSLNFNGRKNLVAAISNDTVFRNAIEELIEIRQDMEPEAFDSTDEIETDFEELS